MTTNFKVHARLVERVRRMEAKLEEDRTKALAALPNEFGFSDLKSFIRALKEAVGVKRVTQGKRRKRSPLPRVEEQKPAPVAQDKAAEVAAAPAVEPFPSGTSLNDPTNFGLLPDSSVLDRGVLSAEAYIGKVGVALRFAERVLHTSRVPARVWREWRAFERKAVEAIQAAR